MAKKQMMGSAVSQVERGGDGRKPRSCGLTGFEGLLISVIGAAAEDARRGMADAIEYFESDWYRQHLDLLSLPVDWLPTGVELN